MKNKMITFGMMIVISIALMGCSSKGESYNPHMNIEVLHREDGTSYIKRNGSEQQNFQIEEGKSCDIHIAVKKEEGKLNLWIAKDGNKENSIYKGTDLPTSQFTVHAEEAGNYMIWIDVDDFIGEYTCDIVQLQ